MEGDLYPPVALAARSPSHTGRMCNGFSIDIGLHGKCPDSNSNCNGNGNGRARMKVDWIGIGRQL